MSRVTNKQRRQLKREQSRETQAQTLNRLYWQNDRRRINSLSIPAGGTTLPRITRALRVENEFFSASATFERRDSIWRCIQADTAVAWLKSTPFNQLKNELLKRGCSWQWSPDNVSASAGEQCRRGHKHESFTMTSRTAARPEMASTAATGETQGMEKLLDQAPNSIGPNSKCSAVPTT